MQNAPVTDIDHDSVCSVPVGSMVALVSGAQKYKPVNLNDLPSTAPEPVRAVHCTCEPVVRAGILQGVMLSCVTAQVTLANANEFLKKRLEEFYQRLDAALSKLPRGITSRFQVSEPRGRSRSRSPDRGRRRSSRRSRSRSPRRRRSRSRSRSRSRERDRGSYRHGSGRGRSRSRSPSGFGRR